MKTTLRILSVPAMLMTVSPALAGSTIPECANANPESVADIQNCIARESGMSFMLQQATINPSICSLTKEVIRKNGKPRAQNDEVPVPTCDTVAKAVTNLNGVRPLWAECTKYDNTQQALNRCAASYLKPQSGIRELDCFSFRLQIGGAIAGASDTPFNAKKDAPSCDMVSQALTAQGIRMTSAECLGYRPNDQHHMEQCLKPSLFAPQNRNRQIPCDELRQHYRGLVTSVMSDPAQIQTFAIPTCPMIEAVAKDILATQGATTNASAAVPVQAPSTAQQPTLGSPSANRSAAPQNTTDAQYGSYPVEATQQRQDRREAEKAEKIQGKIDTANQVLGTLGLGGNTTAPSAAPTSTTTRQYSTPPANETEAQRKARETQQKINTTTDTVNAVKGIFDAFSGAK